MSPRNDDLVRRSEAMRLFLFLKEYGVRHCSGQRHDQARRPAALQLAWTMISSRTTSTKLIQVPIQVPLLGTSEVRAYMMLLFAENSGKLGGRRQGRQSRTKVCAHSFGQAWQEQASRFHAFIESLGIKLPPRLRAQLETADRLAPIMTSASRIHGNPRLIKRFLNALAIRLTIAKAHNIGLDEAALAKYVAFRTLCEREESL